MEQDERTSINSIFYVSLMETVPNIIVASCNLGFIFNSQNKIFPETESEKCCCLSKYIAE